MPSVAGTRDSETRPSRPEVTRVSSECPVGLEVRSYTEDESPFYATRSLEIDILPSADDNGEITRLAGVINGRAAEPATPYLQLHSTTA
jgi:hypothetical protein